MMRKGYLHSLKYPFTNYTLVTKWKVVYFTIGKPGGHHHSQVIMLISPVLRKTNIMWLLMWCSEYDIILLQSYSCQKLDVKKEETRDKLMLRQDGENNWPALFKNIKFKGDKG